MRNSKTQAAGRSSRLKAEIEEVAGDCVAWRARYLARAVGQMMDRRMTGCGLTLSQFGLMSQIAAGDDETLSALAARTGLDPSTLTRNLQALEREGLVEMLPCPQDQRRRRVRLSETGADRLDAAIPAWRKAQAEAATAIDPAALRALADRIEALDA